MESFSEKIVNPRVMVHENPAHSEGIKSTSVGFVPEFV